MADLSFYNFLKAAFRHKIYKNPAASSFNYLGYNLPYKSIGADKGIFEYARRILPKFYTDEFADTEEGNLQMAKKVLEKLERKEDQELVQQFEGFKATQDQQIIEQAKAQSEETPIAAGESAATMSGGGLPSSFPQTSASYGRTGYQKFVRPVGGKEGGTGEGSAATNKAAGIEAEKAAKSPATIKDAQLRQQYKPPSISKFEKAASGVSLQPPKVPGSFINTARSFGSKLGVFFQKNLGKYLTLGRAATGVGAVIGGFTGAAFGGTGIFAGAIGGAILPSWVKSGGAGKFLGKTGNGIINFGARLSNQAGKGGLNLAGPKKKIIWLFFGGFMLFALGAGLLGALNPGGTPTGPGSPTGPILTSDISQCKFTRGGDSVKELTYKSPLLLGYIQEASNISGIPPVILAAFIRVETPSTVTKTDDEIKNMSISNCPTSSNGALGVMQLQPQGTYGHDAGAIENGAKMAGLNYDSLTKTDYCDVRKNIIMGAGFILKRLAYKIPQYPDTYGDGTSWNPSWTTNKTVTDKLVYGYYGCLNYPSCSTGPYNYGDDVSTSIQNCTPSLATGPTTGTSTSILDWALRINDKLEKGVSSRLFNRMVADISNGSYSAVRREGKNEGSSLSGTYWCTDIVIDSYNLSGVRGLNLSHEGVVNMRSAWKNLPGFKYVDYPGTNSLTALRSVGASYAAFWESEAGKHTGREHTAIIKAININNQGDGHIDTYESNNYLKTFTYPVAGGQIQNTLYPTRGFGGT